MFAERAQHQVNLAQLCELARACEFAASDAMAFGLASPLGFLYFFNPHQTPSHWVVGARPNLANTLASHLAQTLAPNELIRLALLANALAFNLDRAPHEAILGMEFLAEELAGWADSSDAESIAQGIYEAIEIEPPRGAFWRGLYLDFLHEAEGVFQPACELHTLLETTSIEWTGLADIMRASNAPRQKFAEGALQIRTLASREEFVWGRVMELTSK